MKKLLLTVVHKWNATSLVLKILIGLLIGVLLGVVCPQCVSIGILGKLFVGMLKAIAPILVFVLVMSSISKSKGGLGSRFRTVITLYLMSTLLAAIVAVVGSFLFPIHLSLQSAVFDEVPAGLSEVFTKLITSMVSNPVQSVVSANYICVLFWAVIIGIALKLTATPTTIEVVGNMADVVSLVVKWIIGFAPLGILGLVFTSVSESGFEIFTIYGKLLALLVGCMLFLALFVNPIIVWSHLHSNPYPLVLYCLQNSGLHAFFTRSSAANIPINMGLCKRMGLDENFYSVSIPLGATINMNGAAITITVLTLSVCHTLGIEVGIVSAILLSILATLAACGASGVAGGSLLLIPMACSLFGINSDIAMQAVAVGFVIGVVQDSMETALNSSGDVIFTATADCKTRKKPANLSRLAEGE